MQRMNLVYLERKFKTREASRLQSCISDTFPCCLWFPMVFMLHYNITSANKGLLRNQRKKIFGHARKI